MFEKNEQHDEALENLIAAAEELGRGDTLLHSAIEEATGYSQLERRYYQVVGRWRKYMIRTHAIAVLEVPNVGWHLCTKQEQVEKYERKHSGKASRSLMRAKVALDVLPDDDLSPTLRLVKAAKLAALKAARSAVRKKQELREVLNRPRQSNPVRELPFGESQASAPTP